MFTDAWFSISCKQEADESLNFEEQILEAAKSIAAATSALVKAASAAQRELVAQGKVWMSFLPPQEHQDAATSLQSKRFRVACGHVWGRHDSSGVKESSTFLFSVL